MSTRKIFLNFAGDVQSVRECFPLTAKAQGFSTMVDAIGCYWVRNAEIMT